MIAFLTILIILFSTKRTSTVDSSYISGVIQEASELTSAKLTYSQVYDHNDNGIPIINKSNFKMFYTATVRAGIDIKDVGESIVDNDKKTITVPLPRARVLSVDVDQGSLKFFDEKFALFNVDARADVADASKMAEKDAIEKAASSGILEVADKQDEYLIKSFIAGAVDKEYTINITFMDDDPQK